MGLSCPVLPLLHGACQAGKGRDTDSGKAEAMTKFMLPEEE
jgi:hypothetical protein